MWVILAYKCTLGQLLRTVRHHQLVLWITALGIPFGIQKLLHLATAVCMMTVATYRVPWCNAADEYLPSRVVDGCEALSVQAIDKELLEKDCIHLILNVRLRDWVQMVVPSPFR